MKHISQNSQNQQLVTKTYNDIPFTIYNRYQGIKLLGAGSYGTVLLALDTQTNTKVAIKKLNPLEDIIDARRMLREIRILRAMTHPNIVAIKAAIYDNVSQESDYFGTVYLVQEYFQADLHRVLKNPKDLTDDHVQFIMYQLTKAVAYLHSASILHRDIKPSNILAKDDCSISLCDFGLSRQIEEYEEEDNKKSQNFTEYVVTRYYRAPEIMVSSQQYSFPIDIWSLGCTFAEILNEGKVLFKGKTYVQMVKMIFETLGKPVQEDLDQFIKNKNAMEFVQSLPSVPPQSIKKIIDYPNPLAIDLLDKMLVINPHKRITAHEALNHPYFKEIREKTEEAPYKGQTDFTFENDDTISFEQMRIMILEELNKLSEKIDIHDEMERLKQLKEKRRAQKHKK
ncbi:unnamed protein product (macronuclear) [Paramecium tetraurelia]|uniref:Protein kinase domain-containing protein n=1 Tax=Paramecium tetraurelia TaxID=5888 RepID=A0CH62_PARTE|nr:uncharacterized protein GSPATT00007569001 [Paramecium tetraurelia]CAK70129.1 unnamed protein product [Paramecium tetraurelia]|eukprot:XP_001437526.1 hypothetical protein (macronuclear) [Paramecium tetraurelia strain d4-2]